MFLLCKRQIHSSTTEGHQTTRGARLLFFCGCFVIYISDNDKIFIMFVQFMQAYIYCEAQQTVNTQTRC